MKQPLAQYEVAGATKRFKVNADEDAIHHAHRDVPDRLWDDPGIILESKEDGHRAKMHVFADCNRFDSRCISVDGGLYVENTDSVVHLRDHPMPDLAGSVFDGELIAGKDSNSVGHALGSHATEEEKLAIDYVVFDLLIYRGRDVRSQPTRVRREMLELCFRDMSIGECPNIILIPQPVMTPEQKRARLVSALLSGAEGVMLKDMSQPYGKGWTKVKREAHYDVIITGYEAAREKSMKKGDDEETDTKYHRLGWIGKVLFSQYVDGRLVEFGKASGFDDATRKEISENKEAFLGRVFEVAAQERFPSGKLRHPRFKRFRPDKPAPECIYRQDEV